MNKYGYWLASPHIRFRCSSTALCRMRYTACITIKPVRNKETVSPWPKGRTSRADPSAPSLQSPLYALLISALWSALVEIQVHVAEQRQCIDQTGQCTPHLRVGKGIRRSRGSHESIDRYHDSRDGPHERVLRAL